MDAIRIARRATRRSWLLATLAGVLGLITLFILTASTAASASTERPEADGRARPWRLGRFLRLERGHQAPQKDDYRVLAPANPLRSLAGDAAYLASFLAQEEGPFVLVGHSYGGAVITNAAAGNPHVQALVYINGFVPDVGEDILHLAGDGSLIPSSIEFKGFPPFGATDVDVYIKQENFRETFAGDVPKHEAAVMAVTQRPLALPAAASPTTAAAWKTIPSWYLLGREDKTITPAAQRFMANRAGATTHEIDASHLSMVSRPGAVVDLIEEAAAAKQIRDRKGRRMSTRTDNGRIPLMLIHGAWLSARSWEHFTDYFAKRGFAVSAPEWPRKEGDVEELRAEAEALKGLGIAEIVDHYEEQIRALEEPPVLIGHSFGGLIVELLLDRGLGRAGVALSPAPPKGILVLPFSSLKAAAPALAHPSKWHGIVTLTLEEFTYGFVNTFSPEEAAAAYERYAVPETGQIFYEAGLRQLPPQPADGGALQERRARAAAHRGRGEGPDGAGLARPQAVREVRALAGARRSTSSSRAGRTCSWRQRAGTRSRRRSTAGSTACSRPRRLRRRACRPSRGHHRPRRWILSSTARSRSSPGLAKESAWPSSTRSSPREAWSWAAHSSRLLEQSTASPRSR